MEKNVKSKTEAHQAFLDDIMHKRLPEVEISQASEVEYDDDDLESEVGRFIEKGDPQRWQCFCGFCLYVHDRYVVDDDAEIDERQLMEPTVTGGHTKNVCLTRSSEIGSRDINVSYAPGDARVIRKFESDESMCTCYADSCLEAVHAPYSINREGEFSCHLFEQLGCLIADTGQCYTHMVDGRLSCIAVHSLTDVMAGDNRGEALGCYWCKDFAEKSLALTLDSELKPFSEESPPTKLAVVQFVNEPCGGVKIDRSIEEGVVEDAVN